MGHREYDADGMASPNSTVYRLLDAVIKIPPASLHTEVSSITEHT